MDIRDIFIDGINQLADWTDTALDGLTPEQVNWLPEGRTTSIGFSAWHIMRTSDNIANFVFQKKQPLWMREDYVGRFGLPPVAQGTGMALDEARQVHVKDVALLREYGRRVTGEVTDFVKGVSPEFLAEVQLIKPLGEMAKARVIRQVLMTHGFMHLGEINLIRGMMGLSFMI
jgi:hypothetical protein